MENSDIDMVISIPDTPDRPVRRGSVINREVKRRPHSPETPLRYHREEYRRTRPPVPEIGENRDNSENGHHHHRSRGSGSSALFRRTAVEKDKGKAISTGPVLNGHVHVTSASIREFRGSSSNGCSSPLQGDRNKGKEKVECGSVSDREIIDISSGKQQNRGTKRLVRHGCISPHAIAARTRQVADTGPKDTVTVEPEIAAAPAETVSSIGIKEIVSGNDFHGRARGKQPEAPRSRDGTERWFSTRNRKLSIGNEMMNQRAESDTHGICSSVSRLEVHETGEVEREARQQRRRKNGVSVIGSSGEPSSSRPPRIHNHHLRHGGTQVLEIEDSSPEVRVVRGPPRRVENDESEVKARQMEADEILARELQEELYRESAMIRDDQIDENIARLLEQEENALRASSSRASTRITRSSSTSAANPGGRSRLEARLQQHSSRRRTNPPAQARAAQVRAAQARALVREPPRGRGHRLGGGPASLHSALNLNFPNDMALESRMDFLEELENVIGHSINNSNLLHMDRDFTEDDYELLLALDENNHRHGGASSHRINNLPESIVQSDNYQETCVICLETPTIGDTIRHLPCLHKFHKDCIDPWLGRSKACPVCKSSVT